MLPNRWAKRLKMQESAQRLLCRLCFLLFAIVPSLSILGVSTWSMTPWAKYWSNRAWERRLSLSFGVDVQLESAVNFAPNSYRLLNIAVKHPETGESIAIIPTIEFQEREHFWHLQIQSPRIAIEKADYLAHVIHQRFLCQPNLAFPPTKCSISQLMFSDDKSVMAPIHFKSVFHCNKEKTSLMANLSLQEQVDTHSARFEIERQHEAEIPTTQWLLQTGEIQIPSAILAAFQPSAAQLGPDATFNGTIGWTHNAVASQTEIRGLFKDVRWSSPNTNVAPPWISKSQVRVQYAQILNGRPLKTEGFVMADSGSNSTLSNWLAAVLSAPPSVQSASHFDPGVQLRQASTGHNSN